MNSRTGRYSARRILFGSSSLIAALIQGCNNPNAVDCTLHDLRRIAVPECVQIDEANAAVHFGQCDFDGSESDAAIEEASPGDSSSFDARFPDASDASTDTLGPVDVSARLYDANGHVESQWPMDECMRLCPSPESVGAQRFLSYCYYSNQQDSSTPVYCNYSVACIGGGRRPAHWRSRRTGDVPDIVGAYFAAMAQLEAASVDAFAILRAELRAHGAPDRLLRAASRSARDEVRHAQTMAHLARRYGASVPVSRVTRGAVRSLEEITIENAREGCVMETWGALVALYQASASSDADVRRAMTTIARDEARHAALAWRIAEWAETRLSSRAKRRVDAARADAVATLRDEATKPVHPRLREIAGLPGAAQSSALLAAAANAFWS